MYSFDDTTALPEGGRGCCPDSQSDLCFHMVANNHGNGTACTAYVYLAVRAVVTHSCHHSIDCRGVQQSACAFPSIPSSSRLVRIKHNAVSPDVLFLGEPRGLFASVAVRDYAPHSQYIPLTLPTVMTTQFSTTFSIIIWSIRCAQCCSSLCPGQTVGYHSDGGGLAAVLHCQ